MYRLLRSILFCFPPEGVHYFSMNCLRLLCTLGFGGLLRRWFRPRGDHRVSVFNRSFPNPVGLGAGFDKNAKYLRELECLGFGFVEIGTVTPRPQQGNDKPRLFRLPKDKALINRMGFNNDGAEAISLRLKYWKEKQQNKTTDSRLPTPDSRLLIGGNIGKNKTTPNEEAWKDYETCFTALHPYVDYFVVNVSSPNTPGLRELQEKESLKKILTGLQQKNSSYPSPKPILLKIAPDLSKEQLDDVADLALEIKLDGLVISNTTIARTVLPAPDSKLPTPDSRLQTPDSRLQSIGAGGLSGLPLKHRSTEIIRYMAQKTHGTIPIIASGGIFTGADAREKLDAGASLVQVWTGFIYEGPGIVSDICRGLEE